MSAMMKHFIIIEIKFILTSQRKSKLIQLKLHRMDDMMTIMCRTACVWPQFFPAFTVDHDAGKYIVVINTILSLDTQWANNFISDSNNWS